MDNIELKEINLQKSMIEEVERLKKFALSVFGKGEDVFKELTSGDIQHYAKYILRDGTKHQRRELLQYLKSKIFMRNKKIYIE